MATTNRELIAAYMLMNDLDCELHTFEGWKSRGFSVKKGEKAKHRITIWKKGKDREAFTNGEYKTIPGRMFLKESCFFEREQVEAIKA